jgi:hypothetical protein
MFDLTGKIALITGSASGIGEAMASTLAAAGAFVYVCDLDETNGSRVASEIGDSAEFLKLNVAEKTECAARAQKVLDEKGKLDILVNNAGIGHVGTLLQTTEDDLDKLYAVNVRGVFSLTKAFLPSMIERKTGVIIDWRIARRNLRSSVLQKPSRSITLCREFAQMRSVREESKRRSSKNAFPNIPIPKKLTRKWRRRKPSGAWLVLKKLPPPRFIWRATKPHSLRERRLKLTAVSQSENNSGIHCQSLFRLKETGNCDELSDFKNLSSRYQFQRS